MRTHSLTAIALVALIALSGCSSEQPDPAAPSSSPATTQSPTDVDPSKKVESGVQLSEDRKERMGITDDMSAEEVKKAVTEYAQDTKKAAADRINDLLARDDLTIEETALLRDAGHQVYFSPATGVGSVVGKDTAALVTRDISPYLVVPAKESTDDLALRQGGQSSILAAVEAAGLKATLVNGLEVPQILSIGFDEKDTIKLSAINEVIASGGAQKTPAATHEALKKAYTGEEYLHFAERAEGK